MYEILAVWFIVIALCTTSIDLMIVTGRFNRTTTPEIKAIEPVRYAFYQSAPIVLSYYFKSTSKPIEPILLGNPFDRETDRCPKCNNYNQANSDMALDYTAKHLQYSIPLERPHKYRGANINALCKPCVDKIHHDIDKALDVKLTDKPSYPSFSYSGYRETLDCEFEILVDDVVVYKGFDYRAIKPAMARKAIKPDKWATPWLAIADIKYDKEKYHHVINGHPYKIIEQDVKKTEIPKIIKGLQAQGKEYVVSLNDKRYIVLERLTDKIESNKDKVSVIS